MMLSAITPDQVSPLIQSVSNKSARKSDDDENDLLQDEESIDPKYTVQRTLIRELFTDTSDEDETVSVKSVHIDGDTVELSAEAVELSRRAEGEITVRNGQEKLTVRFEHEERLRMEQVQVQAQEQQPAADPLVIDLDRDGVELTDARNGGGVSFDITGDGVRETVSWVSRDDGFLAYDRNGNGVIDSGRELFGDQHGAADGFAELARFDENNDTMIDARDSIFSSLKIWQDANANGASDAGELKGLDEWGITGISIRSDGVSGISGGNRIQGYSNYETTSGSGTVAEAWLNIVA